MDLNWKEMNSMALFHGTFVSLDASQKPEKAKESAGRPGRGNALLNWLSGRRIRAPRQGRSALAESDRAPVNPDYLWHFQFTPH
jgi:hypothetical protein